MRIERDINQIPRPSLFMAHPLSKLDCQLSTLYGLVHVAYTRDERDTFAKSILMRLTIPANTQAKVVFEPLFLGAKCVTIIEDDQVIWSVTDKQNNVIEDSRTGLMTVHIGYGFFEYQVLWE